MSLKEEPETLTLKQTSIMLQVVLKGNQRFLGLCDFESEKISYFNTDKLENEDS